MSKTTTTTHTPQLRFPGFSDNWEEKKLGSISTDILYWIGASAIDYDWHNKYLRITDIDEKTRKFVPSPLTSPDQKVEKKYLLKENDIVFARTWASVGKSYIYDKNDWKLIFAWFLIKFSINKANSNFVFNYTLRENYYKRVSSVSVRSWQPWINAEEYKSFKLSLPSLPEQEKIASFLSTVDQKIEQLQSLQQNRISYKQGVMQQIFSQSIRFQDEEGNDFPEWEEKKLGEIAKIISWKSKSKYIDLNWDNIIVDMWAIWSDWILIKTKKTTYDWDYLSIGDLVMAKDDIGWWNIIWKVIQIDQNKKYVLWDHVYKLRVSSWLSEFLFYAINSFEINKSFRKKANWTAQIWITKWTVENQIIPFPPIKEQEKIANFLSSLDKKIEQIEQQIEQLQVWKKGLLQKMFI